MSKAPINEEYVEQTADADEYQEVKGGNYAPVHDFDANPYLKDVIYQGVEAKNIKGRDTTIHTFLANATQDDDGVWTGDEIQAWGAAILDSRLEGLEGAKVMVHKTGAKLTSKSGNTPWEYKVFVAKGSVAR